MKIKKYKNERRKSDEGKNEVKGKKNCKKEKFTKTRSNKLKRAYEEEEKWIIIFDS